MKFVTGFPPNIDAIDAVFHVKQNPGVIFTYGDTVYIPSGKPLTPELRAHEGFHIARQTNPEQWWDQYLVDPEFRLAEELPAHRAEYQTFCERHGDKNQRSRYLFAMSGRLCGPMYGNLMGPGKARGLIQKGLR